MDRQMDRQNIINKQNWNCPDNLIYYTTEVYSS